MLLLSSGTYNDAFPLHLSIFFSTFLIPYTVQTPVARYYTCDGHRQHLE